MKTSTTFFMALLSLGLTACSSDGPASREVTETSGQSSEYSWDTGFWSTCANGMQSRTVACVDSNNSTVSDRKCTSFRPTESQSCTLSGGSPDPGSGGSPDPGSGGSPDPGSDSPSGSSYYEEKITQIFLQYLGREPDGPGLQFYLDEIAKGMTLSEVEAFIGNSPEAKIRGFYLTHLQREPDPAGRRFYLDEYYDGSQTLDEIRIGIRASDECRHDCI